MSMPVCIALDARVTGAEKLERIAVYGSESLSAPLSVLLGGGSMRHFDVFDMSAGSADSMMMMRTTEKELVVCVLMPESCASHDVRSFKRLECSIEGHLVEFALERLGKLLNRYRL
jgi:hypothetical protein